MATGATLWRIPVDSRTFSQCFLFSSPFIPKYTIF
jgi:hypothetical protein